MKKKMSQSGSYLHLTRLSATELIRHLKLEPLEGEGGYFRQTYKANRKFFPNSAAPNMSRAFSTCILYLISSGDCSRFHRVQSDEIFHFYAGDPVQLIQIPKEGIINRTVLGHSILEGQALQAVVPAGVWQGSYIENAEVGWALLGTTVSPGFEYDDFELGSYEEISKLLPSEIEVVKRLTKK